ncbi:MAG: DNA translocase FtsK [Armatimonadetes bacterium]|nr:DNA translocase FtsK [Armatimonadota bacterium]MDE2206765.1 DNA translocase FtsK [Armatimonadota bacterium]
MSTDRRRSAAAAPMPARRMQDLIGLALFCFGAISLISLATPQPGPVPTALNAALRLAAGDGSWAIPLGTMFAGSMFLIGYQRLSLSHSSIGTLLLWLAFVCSRQLDTMPAGATWNPALASGAGGAAGWAIGAGLSAAAGGLIARLVIVFSALAGIVLLADRPLIDVARRCLDLAAPAGRAGTAMTRRAGSGFISRLRAYLDRRAEVRAEALIEQEDDEEGEEDLREYDGLASTVPEPAEMKEPARVFALPASEAVAADTTAATITAAVEQKTEPAPVPLTARPESNGKPAQPSLTGFALPPLSLLKDTGAATAQRTQAEVDEKARIIERTLEEFRIGATVVEVAAGPTITRFEIQLAPGIKVSKIVSLADNLTMSLAAIDVRVEAPIPGKSAIGVEVPNAHPVTVRLRECLNTQEFQEAPSLLTIALGKDVAGQHRYADLTRMPHLLIGGSTNSGKSVFLNTLIASLVYRATPEEVKLLMVDPKQVELSLWDGIPHLLHPVVKDVKQAAGLFRAALKEMSRRFDLFAAIGTRGIDGYNSRVTREERLPYMVLIVDELSDLMMQQGPEVEASICRLAQMARATGIHLVLATQRPSVNVVTGTIKANICSRIAFAVASQVDSRTILDAGGADRLIGRGDLLFLPLDAAKPTRIQGCYMSEADTNALVSYLRAQGRPDYSFEIPDPLGGGGRDADEPGDDVDDEFFEQAVRLVVTQGQCSVSSLQRKFRIGYTRAARIAEMMEERGIVGPPNGAKPRDLLISPVQAEELFRVQMAPAMDGAERETDAV